VPDGFFKSKIMSEQFVIYAIVFLFCGIILFIYLRKLKKESRDVEKKVVKAKQEGLFEPVSLYPEINENKCIKSGACVTACPEKDILGIMNGRATLINASQCIGHGACFHSCPVEAISLVIGTEKRGVDLPHIDQDFQTNIPGIYIAGELGGMGLIKNSVEQGKTAVENMIKSGFTKDPSTFDLLIIGAGPAGISASLMAKKHNLNFLTLEQDSLGGTVYTFPRSKIVMTSPMNLPLYGKVRLYNTTKTELLELWQKVLSDNNISIKERTKVEKISFEGDHFRVNTNTNEEIKTKRILLAIGRRGSPRKLNISGEESEKVAYRLLEPENIQNKDIVVVGGGDSAIEAALSLAWQNKVIISYRSEAFSRIKPKNRELIYKAAETGILNIKYKSNLVAVEKEHVTLNVDDKKINVKNDLVYIFAGGELPTQFLEKAGVRITRRFGYTLKKYG
jgi:thioredoxin reductase/NAD-dependent dihydropyrimidine dehydrogenase PreA subunit